MKITCTVPDQLSGRDAIVEEQDTNLLAGLKPEITDTMESYPALVSKMQWQKPMAPGEVLIKREIPVRFIAIVYDINYKTVCREEWIVTALRNILAECNALKIHTLVMPVLGAYHGDTKKDHFHQLLETVVSDQVPDYPEKICLFTREM